MKIFEDGAVPSEDEIAYCTSFGRLVSVRKTDNADFELREYYKMKRALLTEKVKRAVTSFSGFEEDFTECGEVTVILCEMLKKYQELIWEKNAEKMP